MASSVELGGQAEDQISVFAWPELTRAVLYQSTDSLQTIAIDPTGQTVYFWTYGHAGPSSIWYVNGSGRAKILAQTDSGATGSIYWSAGGIVRVAQGDDPTILKVWRTDFSGKTSLVQQRDATMGALMTRDGPWLVVINKGGGSDPTGDSYTVVHAGTESTVTADGTGELLGMTQDRSSIVYRPLSDKGASGMLSLHVLPINGGPEKIASVPLPVAGPIAAMGMSDQGVLAYTDGRYQTSELCTATLRLGA